MQGTYLGWDLPAHRAGCERTEWTVDLRTEHGAYRHPIQGRPHDCPNEHCDHSTTLTRVVVRLLCADCGTVETIDAADPLRERTTTARGGYGMNPRPMYGLYLYPGAPWLDFGRRGTPTPHDYLVTTTIVDRLEAEHVVGQITQALGKRGAVRWSATALPRPDGPILGHGALRWSALREGISSVGSAAKWIRRQVDAAAGGDTA
ncbi:hypothetical protein AAFN69_21110 [Streptomyces sp. CAU 1734]